MGVFLLVFMTDDGFMVLDESKIETAEDNQELVEALNAWIANNGDAVMPIDEHYLTSIKDITDFIADTKGVCLE